MSDLHANWPQQSPPAHAEGHGETHGNHGMHLKLYWGIGGLLFIFTVITVALSYLDFDKWFGGKGWNIIIAMIVATFKVGLVCAIFMHLKGEKPTVWRFLYFTMFFALGLFLLTYLHWVDPIFGTVGNSR